MSCILTTTNGDIVRIQRRNEGEEKWIRGGKEAFLGKIRRGQISPEGGKLGRGFNCIPSFLPSFWACWITRAALICTSNSAGADRNSPVEQEMSSLLLGCAALPLQQRLGFCCLVWKALIKYTTYTFFYVSGLTNLSWDLWTRASLNQKNSYF